jgi:uncharacterized protein (TIGR03067 family)
VFALGAPAPKENRKFAEPPAGEWQIVLLELNGNAIKAKLDKDYSLSIDKDSMSVQLLGLKFSTERVAFFEGNEIDFNPGDAKMLRRGIWKLNGDELLICDGGLNKPRPKEFSTSDGGALWKLRRLTKDKK